MADMRGGSADASHNGKEACRLYVEARMAATLLEPPAEAS